MTVTDHQELVVWQLARELERKAFAFDEHGETWKKAYRARSQRKAFADAQRENLRKLGTTDPRENDRPE